MSLVLDLTFMPFGTRAVRGDGLVIAISSSPGLVSALLRRQQETSRFQYLAMVKEKTWLWSKAESRF